MNTLIPVLVVALFAAFLSFQAAKDAARKGSKLKGCLLAAVVGLAVWALLAQGFRNEWPMAVGVVAFLAGALEALTTSKDAA